jgi:DNA-binding transcriptional LysR family regulator
MVSMGFGWAVLPEAVAAGAGDLVPVGEAPLVTRPLQAVTRADAPEDARVLRLLELAAARPA